MKTNWTHSNFGLFVNYAPRVVSSIAGAIALIALATLAVQHLSVMGTASNVTPFFQTTCLNIAKWSGVAMISCVAISFIKDIAFARARKSSTKELGWELLFTSAVPFAYCLFFRKP